MGKAIGDAAPMWATDSRSRNGPVTAAGCTARRQVRPGHGAAEPRTSRAVRSRQVQAPIAATGSAADTVEFMAISTVELSPAAVEFVTERHLATLTTLRADGTPHVVAVGFTWDQQAGLARIITNDGSVKVRNVRRSGYAAVSQVDGIRWLTLEGPATVLDDADSVAEAVRRYAQRYRVPRENPTRVVIEIQVRKALCSGPLTAR